MLFFWRPEKGTSERKPEPQSHGSSLPSVAAARKRTRVGTTAGLPMGDRALGDMVVANTSQRRIIMWPSLILIALVLTLAVGGAPRQGRVDELSKQLIALEQGR